MAVQVQFAHPWTDPDSGISYSTGQLAMLDEELAKRVVFNGIARYPAGGEPIIPPGIIDDVELGQVLATYEKKVPRGGANPGYVVTLGSDGQTLQLSPGAGGGGEGVASPDATGSIKGLVRLTGDLGGTADSPLVPGLSTKLDLEQVQDAVADMLVAGANVTKVYDDSTGKVTLSATGGAGGATDPEVVRDTVAAALQAGTGITITSSDAGDTITISATGAGGATDQEVVRDTIAAALVAGTNVTITPSDAGDTITISATGGGSGLAIDAADGGAPTSTYNTPLDTQEIIRDTIATALVAGPGVVITTNDAGDTITLSSTGSTDPEIVRDTVAAALVGGANVTVTPNDAGDTITIAATTDPEVVRDTIAATLQAGAGLTIVHDDALNTITFTATGGGGGGGVDAEAVRDTIGAALRAGSNIGIATDDALDTITISTTATSNSPDAFLLARTNHTGTQPASTISDFQSAVLALAAGPGSPMNPHTNPNATRNANFAVNFWSTWPTVPANATGNDQLLVPADGQSGPTSVYYEPFSGTLNSWTVDGSSATATYSTERFVSSPGAMRLAATASGAGMVRAASPKFNVTVGASYTVTARVSCSNGPRAMTLGYRLYNSSGTVLGSGSGAATGLTETGSGIAFNTLVWTMVVPNAGAVTQMDLVLTVTGSSNANGDVYFIDDVTVG